MAVENLSIERIAKIKRDFRIRSQSRTKPPIQKPTVGTNQAQSLTDVQSRRQADDVFKPPIPLPSNEVEVKSVTDVHYPPHDDCKYLNFNYF